MGNKKASIIGGSAILVLAVVATIVVVTVNHKSSTPAPATTTEDQSTNPSTTSRAVKSICQPTRYRETCENVLSKAVGKDNNTDIKHLIKLSFEVSVDHIKEAAKHSALLTAASNDPYSVNPLKTCGTLFDYAVQDLQVAIDNILNYEFNELDKAVYDLKTWLTAANTYQENCVDEFQNATSDAAVSMKQALNTSMELTSNALAIVDQVSSMVSSFKLPSLLDGAKNQRRLLNIDFDGFPTWMSQAKRRLLQLSPLQMAPTVTVAQDGSGQFRTINEAIASLPRNNDNFVVVHVKAGIYKETVLVEKALNKLVLVGDGPAVTRITGNLNVFFGGGIGTIQTATFAVVGPDFMAKDIAFENSAGPEGHQAVAFRSQSDRSVLVNCHFDGYQDTLYTQTNHQFYKDCMISGTVDFIFGNAAAIFQNCVLVARKPMDNQANMFTAHGSKEPTETTAYVFQNCRITAEPALQPFVKTIGSYLGRPWKPYARTIYMQSQIDDVVNPEGWMTWVGSPSSETTCFYAEVDNRGAGSNTDGRVKWAGVRHLTLQDMNKYTLDSYFMQAPWVKAAGLPDVVTGLYPAGLSVATGSVSVPPLANVPAHGGPAPVAPAAGPAPVAPAAGPAPVAPAAGPAPVAPAAGSAPSPASPAGPAEVAVAGGLHMGKGHHRGRGGKGKRGGRKGGRRGGRKAKH